MPTQWFTARLAIRRFRPEDLTAFWDGFHNDPETMKYIGGVWTLERARETLGRIIANYQQSDLDWYAVVKRKDNIMVGACWIAPPSARYQEALGAGHIELGYRFARAHWGQGYATEAGEAMLHRGFVELDLPRIIAIVNQENVASDRVLMKLGMRHQRTFQHNGASIKFYSLSQAEYLARRDEGPGAHS